jgi:hypothetical protein
MFKYFGIISGVAMALIGEVVTAMADGVLDGAELSRLIKRGVMSLRMAGVSQTELDQIQVITDRFEFDALPFNDGDLLVYAPQELLEKLKIKV